MQTIFKRFEKKYIVSRSQFERLMEKLPRFVRKDAFPAYRVDTIYYDTSDYALIQRSLDHPTFKEKYRIRHYENCPLLFYELKKKFDGIVYKRRMTSKETNEQIRSEILAFLQEEEVEEKILIRYDRLAYVDRQDPTVRITFDRNIRFQRQILDFEVDRPEAFLFDEGQVVLEIKTEHAIPYWLSRLLSELEIFPTSCSKYGMIYSRFLRKEALCSLV